MWTKLILIFNCLKMIEMTNQRKRLYRPDFPIIVPCQVSNQMYLKNDRAIQSLL